MWHLFTEFVLVDLPFVAYISPVITWKVVLNLSLQFALYTNPKSWIAQYII